jgi:Rrf2 family iron-sulfur cluster assembly transcriptional regulator
MFSKACEYGILATLHIAVQSGKGNRVSLKDIAKAIDSPEAFTAKILQQLSRDGIIHSMKGPAGGFELEAAHAERIKLSHIVTCIDGDQIYKGCGLGLKTCNEFKPCPVHYQFKLIREELRTMLESTSIKTLSESVHDGLSFLKR